MYQNTTLFYHITPILFEGREPPDEYFTIPSCCKKPMVGGQPLIARPVTNWTVPRRHGIHTISSMNFDGPNVIKGDFTKSIHPVVKEMMVKATNKKGLN